MEECTECYDELGRWFLTACMILEKGMVPLGALEVMLYCALRVLGHDSARCTL